MVCKHKRNIILKLFDYIWSLFLNGLFILLPITLTGIIFNASFKLLKSWLEPISAILPDFLKSIPQAEIIIALVTILFLGTILKIFILKKIIHFIEDLIESIPIIRPIYSGIKQLTQAFGQKDQLRFKKVVMVEFPRNGIYSIGFLTNELPELTAEKEEPLFSIFIPTTPNPTNGYFILVEEKEITTLDITRQEAMALIISGGIIKPRTFHDKKK